MGGSGKRRALSNPLYFREVLVIPALMERRFDGSLVGGGREGLSDNLRLGVIDSS